MTYPELQDYLLTTLLTQDRGTIAFADVAEATGYDTTALVSWGLLNGIEIYRYDHLIKPDTMVYFRRYVNGLCGVIRQPK